MSDPTNTNGNGAGNSALLQLRGICRSFGPVRAVHEVGR